jgi:hypothetical protein
VLTSARSGKRPADQNDQSRKPTCGGSTIDRTKTIPTNTYDVEGQMEYPICQNLNIMCHWTNQENFFQSVQKGTETLYTIRRRVRKPFYLAGSACILLDNLFLPDNLQDLKYLSFLGVTRPKFFSIHGLPSQSSFNIKTEVSCIPTSTSRPLEKQPLLFPSQTLKTR